MNGLACPECGSTKDITVDWRTAVTASFKDGVVEYVSLAGWLDGGDLIYFSCNECGFNIETSWGDTPVPSELSRQANEQLSQLDDTIADAFVNGLELYESAEHRQRFMQRRTVWA